MRLIRLVPFLFWCSAAVAQSTIQLLQEADSCYRAKDYVHGADRYLAAAKIDTSFAGFYYKAACCYAQAKERALAYKYIDEAINHGWREYEWTKKDSAFVSLRADKEWRDRLARLQALVDEEEKRTNKPYRAELLIMYEDDQNTRHAIESQRFNHDTDSTHLRSLWKIQDAKDSINLAKLERLVGKYNWPTKSSVGAQACLAAFLIIQHSPLPVQERYFSMIETAMKAGDIDKRFFALLVDRIRVRKGQKQLYGSQITQLGNGKFEIYPIEDEINVDIRRREMGMEPLAESVKSWNIKYVPPKQ